MTSPIHLVTGATGFLGSHLVERLVQNGQRVRALARPSSDTRFLDRLGVEKIAGDLTDPSSVERACRDVDIVFHAGAKVADWGSRREFEMHIVHATRNLSQAAQRASVRRFVHISSVSAYAHSGEKNLVLDETAPLAEHTQRWDHYAHAKAQAEKELWTLYARGGLPLAVIRPAWVYGPRDRAFVARFHRLLSRGKVCILGDGSNLVSTIFVQNVVDACLLVAASERAVGEAYNCSSDGPLTQREFLRLWAEAFGCPPPARSVPYPLAHFGGLVCECVGHLLHWQTPPPITRHSVGMLGRRPYFPTDKIQKQLGWKPAVSYQEGIHLTARWYLDQLA